MLGGRVDRQHRIADEPEDGRQVDDDARALGEHRGEDGAAEYEERAEEVRVHDRRGSPRRVWSRSALSTCTAALFTITSIRPGRAKDGRHDLADARARSPTSPARTSRPVRPIPAMASPRSPPVRSGSRPDDEHARALGRVGLGDRATDAATAPGHDRDPRPRVCPSRPPTLAVDHAVRRPRRPS